MNNAFLAKHDISADILGVYRVNLVIAFLVNERSELETLPMFLTRRLTCQRPFYSRNQPSLRLF
jgi:hypothetical protein